MGFSCMMGKHKITASLGGWLPKQSLHVRRVFTQIKRLTELAEQLQSGASKGNKTYKKPMHPRATTHHTHSSSVECSTTAAGSFKSSTTWLKKGKRLTWRWAIPACRNEQSTIGISISNPIYALYSGYLLGIPPFIGLLWGVKQGTIPRLPPFSLWIYNNLYIIHNSMYVKIIYIYITESSSQVWNLCPLINRQKQTFLGGNLHPSGGSRNKFYQSCRWCQTASARLASCHWARMQHSPASPQHKYVPFPSNSSKSKWQNP